MRRRWRGPLLVALGCPLAVVLQGTVLHGAGPGGVTPNLVLLLVLVAAWRWGVAGGSAAGFWGGLWVGAARVDLCGPMSLAYLVLGVVAGSYLESNPGRELLDLPVLAAGMTIFSAVLELVACNLLDIPCRIHALAVGCLMGIHALAGLGLAVVAGLVPPPVAGTSAR